MKLTIAILNDHFILSELSPSGLIWNPERSIFSFPSGAAWDRYKKLSAGRIAGSLKDSPSGMYWRVQIGNHKFYNHRIIWMLHNEEIVPPQIPIDHADGNTENNDISNLRISSINQNMQNSKMRTTNTTGYKGVFRNYNKFCAEIQVNGKRIRIGSSYTTAEEAHTAYIEAAEKYHGEFARRY